MARSIAEIQVQLQQALVTQFATAGITLDTTTWSKRNLLRAMTFAYATGQATQEQLMDAFKTQIELDVLSSAAASNIWLQAAMFAFQYSTTNPQIVQIINGIIQYPVIDTTLRPVTACSVSSTSSNNVVIKFAINNPLQAADPTMVAAAQSYINYKGTAGIKYTVQSLNPDQIYINANIWYQGQYSAVIQTNVIAAINAYFQTLSLTNFDGSVKMSDIEGMIRNIQGVNDVELLNVRGRQDSSPFANGIDLIVNTAILQRQWVTVAGYTIPETTAGKTLTSSLNFIAQ